MTLTVTAVNDATPPRFEIELVPNDGQPITSVVLSRTVNGVTHPTRVQPNVGSSYGYVEDVEEPWGVDVFYSAVAATAGGTATYTAAGVQLNPVGAWAIHPLTPALSVCIDRQYTAFVGVIGIDTVSRAAQSTQHQILGSARPITTRVGPRASSRGSLRIAAVTRADEDAIWDLVDDQTPLVIQFPPAWGVNWEYGYYDIGDVTADRVLQLAGDYRRQFTLPFTHVDAPAGTTQSTWTWAKVLNDFASWADLTASFASWRDVLSDTEL